MSGEVVSINYSKCALKENKLRGEGGHLSNDLKKFGRVEDAGEKSGAVADRHYCENNDK